MGVLQRLRDLDNRVLGPPKPSSVRWWARLGGLFGWLAAYGATRIAEPGASWFSVVALVVGFAYIAAMTAVALRDPAKVGRHSDLALPSLWILLGVTPWLLEPRARELPYVLVYAATVAVGIVTLGIALWGRGTARSG